MEPASNFSTRTQREDTARGGGKFAPSQVLIRAQLSTTSSGSQTATQHVQFKAPSTQGACHHGPGNSTSTTHAAHIKSLLCRLQHSHTGMPALLCPAAVHTRRAEPAQHALASAAHTAPRPSDDKQQQWTVHQHSATLSNSHVRSSDKTVVQLMPKSCQRRSVPSTSCTTEPHLNQTPRTSTGAGGMRDTHTLGRHTFT